MSRRCAAATGVVMAATLMVAAAAQAQPLVISRAGSRAVRPAPAENFTGAVQVEMLFDAVDPSHASGGSVTFAPGARTAWHVHPRGQVLVITAGTGRVQRWGDAIHQVQAGDVVRIPAGQKHWHGAAPAAAVTHLAISEHREGVTVQWLEPVSDDQYRGPVAAALASPASGGRPSGALQQKVAPGMAALTDDVLYGDVWRRPDLTPRDRSLVTVTALIALGTTGPLAGHLTRALDNGVTPAEASGLLAHLAIYCGWPNAVAALEVYDQVYIARKIDTSVLRTGIPPTPAAAPVTDAARADTLTRTATFAPQFAQLTNTVVFADLWHRTDVGPRDRSLATIVAMAAMGDEHQLEVYVRRGRDAGLTRAQIAEALTHLAFYAGWGKATRAIEITARAWDQ